MGAELALSSRQGYNPSRTDVHTYLTPGVPACMYVRMRRNLTISFDEHFILQMDEARIGTSRGLWLEGLVEGGAILPVVIDQREQARRDAEDKNPPPPKATRSPEPDLPEHIRTGRPSVKPTHPAYQGQLRQIEQHRKAS